MQGAVFRSNAAFEDQANVEIGKIERQVGLIERAVRAIPSVLHWGPIGLPAAELVSVSGT